MEFKKFLREDQNTLNVVQNYLYKIEQAGFRLLAHQTSDDTAHKIISSQDFGRAGVHGTALFVNSQQIRQTVEKMTAAHAAATGGNWDAYRQASSGIHKGANAIVILAIPKTFQGRGTSELDDYLADLMAQGKIKDLQIPNRYIIGYWRGDGQFLANGKFNPRGIL